jgi:hypothetical protein
LKLKAREPKRLKKYSDKILERKTVKKKLTVDSSEEEL